MTRPPSSVGSPSRQPWLRCASAALLLAALAATFGACSANKNYEERRRYADENPLYPDAGICVDTCAPDPGSRPVDCAKLEEGIEFMTPALFTFDDDGAPPTVARGLYTYSDCSEDFMLPRGYQPPVTQAERCGRSNVFHLQGGLFRGWGGGIGISLTNYVSAPCRDAGAVVPCTKPDAEFTGTLDASDWDGISFWARRGPGSQAEIRVLAGDKYTDDDLNVASYEYCKLVRTCDCENHKPCTTHTFAAGQGNGVTEQLCFDPAVDPPPDAPTAGREGFSCGDAEFRGLYQPCGEFRCNEAHPTGAAAPLINNRACTPHTFQTGETRDVCYDRGSDPPPPESRETCGDHWTSTVVLGLDWQFYTVPFSSMRQQGFAKESPRLLTDELSVIRFTWDGGWIDYWIDDVRFYRVKR